MKICRVIAIGTVFALSCVSTVFAQVTTKDGRPLSYYAPGPYARTTAGLIQTGNGNCEAWTFFFLDTLKVHGISTKGAVIKIGYPPMNGKYSILMREWIFEGDGKSGDAEYPYVNIFEADSTPLNIETMTKLLYCEVKPGIPIPGQNNSNPPNQFAYHQFAYINGKYYDPSYGTESDDDRDFMLSGYMQILGRANVNESTFGKDLNGDGIIGTAYLPCVLYKKHKKNSAPHEIADY